MQYIIMNVGMSTNFGTPDLAHLTFPTTMRVDYVRVYQDPSNINIGCDPPDFPTAAYINECVHPCPVFVHDDHGFHLVPAPYTCRYIEAYTNPNLTTWQHDYGQPVPGNSFMGDC